MHKIIDSTSSIAPILEFMYVIDGTIINISVMMYAPFLLWAKHPLGRNTAMYMCNLVYQTSSKLEQTSSCN